MLNLTQAAALTGMNRSSILRAIKRRAITGSKDHNGDWFVDEAELSRVFPVTARAARQPDDVVALKFALAEERILAEMRQECHRAVADKDAWRVQSRQPAAPLDAQQRTPSRWWPWRRAAG